jgi:hypothetical protein
MNNIKIVRFVDGTDIVSNVEELIEGEFLFTNPMAFNIQNRGVASHITLGFYLPQPFVEHNEMIITKKDILFMVTPKEEFCEYYENSVNQFNEDESEVETGSMSEKLKDMMMKAFVELDPEEKVIH